MQDTKWWNYLEEEFKKPYFIDLHARVQRAYGVQSVFPAKEDLFNAFTSTDIDKVKVVILGQDPYYRPDQAHGLSFSVQEHVPVPPTLRNIFRELQDDVGVPIPAHGDLTKWTEKGVLLLNSILTVAEGTARSHQSMGWSRFTDEVIRILNNQEQPIVFILWGNYARGKKRLITNQHHLIIEGFHPSPNSSFRGFFGSKPFSQANQFLIDNDVEPIDWKL